MGPECFYRIPCDVTWINAAMAELRCCLHHLPPPPPPPAAAMTGVHGPSVTFLGVLLHASGRWLAAAKKLGSSPAYPFTVLQYAGCWGRAGQGRAAR